MHRFANLGVRVAPAAFCALALIACGTEDVGGQVALPDGGSDPPIGEMTYVLKPGDTFRYVGTTSIQVFQSQNPETQAAYNLLVTVADVQFQAAEAGKEGQWRVGADVAAKSDSGVQTTRECGAAAERTCTPGKPGCSPGEAYTECTGMQTPDEAMEMPECSENEVCAAGLCKFAGPPASRPACASSGDCAQGLVCSASRRVCTRNECESDANCEAPLVCHPSGRDELEQAWYSAGGPLSSSEEASTRVSFLTRGTPLAVDRAAALVVERPAGASGASTRKQPDDWIYTTLFRSLLFLDPRRFKDLGKRYLDTFDKAGIDLVSNFEPATSEISSTFNFVAKFVDQNDPEKRVRSIRLEYDAVCGFLVQATENFCHEGDPTSRRNDQNCNDATAEQPRVSSLLRYNGGSAKMHPCRARAMAGTAGTSGASGASAAGSN